MTASSDGMIDKRNQNIILDKSERI